MSRSSEPASGVDCTSLPLARRATLDVPFGAGGVNGAEYPVRFGGLAGDVCIGGSEDAIGIVYSEEPVVRVSRGSVLGAIARGMSVG